MPKYRFKPIEIEARQVNSEDYDDLIDIVRWCNGIIDISEYSDDNYLFYIQSLDIANPVHNSDWVIKNPHGIFSICEPEIFDNLYEPVDTVNTYPYPDNL